MKPSWFTVPLETRTSCCQLLLVHPEMKTDACLQHDAWWDWRESPSSSFCGQSSKRVGCHSYAAVADDIISVSDVLHQKVIVLRGRPVSYRLSLVRLLLWPYKAIAITIKQDEYYQLLWKCRASSSSSYCGSTLLNAYLRPSSWYTYRQKWTT